MKLLLRDHLNWVWQVFLSWLAVVATNIYIPTCLNRSTKMVIKAKDPEMAVGRDADEIKAKEPPGVLLMQVEEVEQEAAGVVIKDSRVNVLSDGKSDGVLSTDQTLNSERKVKLEDEFGVNGFVEDAESSQTVDAGSAVVVEESVQSNESQTDGELTPVLADHSSSNPDEGNVLNPADIDENGNDSIVVWELNEDESDDDDEDNEDNNEEEESGKDAPVDPRLTWLLDLGSKWTYREVLSPHYYCLNFSTAAPLETDTIVTAVKQLRSLVPWLGFGLRQHKSNVWLCLYPDEVINFQNANSYDSLWNVLINCRDQFNYINNKCLSTFVLMKAQPCAQCQAVWEFQIDASPVVSAEISMLSPNEAHKATVTNSSSASVNGPISDGSTCSCTCTMGLDKGFCGNACKGDSETTNVKSSRPCNTCDVLYPSVSDTARQENTIDTSISVLHAPSENNLTTNSFLQPSSVANIAEGRELSYNYRLVFGVPHPLADEESVNMICDVFINQLNTVISKIKSVNPTEMGEKNSNGTCEDIDKNGETNRTSESECKSNESECKSNESECKSNESECNSNESESNSNESECNSRDDCVSSSQQCDDAASASCNGISGAVDPNEVIGNVVKDIAHQEPIACSDEHHQDITAENKAKVQEQFTLLENIFANRENTDTNREKNAHAQKNSNNNNNDVRGINTDGPTVYRKIEPSVTRNFMNKCKTEKVSYISAFVLCVNAAVAKTLVKCGIKDENEDLKIGHIISQYYNLDDLSDDEWHDRDPADDDNGDDDDDDDDDDSDDERPAVCCRKPTIILNRKPGSWEKRLWESVQAIDLSRKERVLESSSSRRQLIALGAGGQNKDHERFSSISHPYADLIISSISDIMPTYSRKFKNVESFTQQKMSPLIIFLMTNSISVSVHEGSLRFSFYHHECFISNATAHEYADAIVSALNRVLVS